MGKLWLREGKYSCYVKPKPRICSANLRPSFLIVNAYSQQRFICIFLQGYIVVPADKRFLLLFTFLKKNMKKKVMVFFSSCNSVKYHSELLNYIDIPVMDIHVSDWYTYCKCIVRVSSGSFEVMQSYILKVSSHKLINPFYANVLFLYPRREMSQFNVKISCYTCSQNYF